MVRRRAREGEEKRGLATLYSRPIYHSWRALGVVPGAGAASKPMSLSGLTTQAQRISGLFPIVFRQVLCLQSDKVSANELVGVANGSRSIDNDQRQAAAVAEGTFLHCRSAVANWTRRWLAKRYTIEEGIRRVKRREEKLR